MEFDLQQFRGPCACGKEHPIEVREILLNAGALDRLPELVRKYGGKRPVMVCDDNTYEAAGKRVEMLVPGCARILLPPGNLHANEHGVELAASGLDRLPEAPDCLLAVGSGTVHDITRYIAAERKLPFLSVPTAASVDGFVSTVAAMTWHGFKKTFPAVAPVCVVADSGIFSKAPQRLTASGASDLLGKYTALADWKIAHAVTGEYLCERVCGYEMQALDAIRSCLGSLKDGGIDAHEKLMYGLLLSGLAMQMIGNSRPASGAEHHFSHLWEIEVINPHIDAYHGEKVGVGLLTAAGIYHEAEARLRSGAFRTVKYRGLELELLREAFRDEDQYQEMITENRPDPLSEISPEHLLRKKEEILRILSEIPSEDELRSMLREAGAPCTMRELGLDSGLRERSVCLSPYVRNRLTFLRLLKLSELYQEFLP